MKTDVLERTGRLMCERLDAKAEEAKRQMLKSDSIGDIWKWEKATVEAENARLTFKQWQEGKL